MSPASPPGTFTVSFCTRALRWQHTPACTCKQKQMTDKCSCVDRQFMDRQADQQNCCLPHLLPGCLLQQYPEHGWVVTRPSQRFRHDSLSKAGAAVSWGATVLPQPNTASSSSSCTSNTVTGRLLLHNSMWHGRCDAARHTAHAAWTDQHSERRMKQHAQYMQDGLPRTAPHVHQDLHVPPTISKTQFKKVCAPRQFSDTHAG